MQPYFEIEERLQYANDRTERTNRHSSTNGEEWGEYRKFGKVWIRVMQLPQYYEMTLNLLLQAIDNNRNEDAALDMWEDLEG